MSKINKMLAVTELKQGIFFQEKGVPYEVLRYEHLKMGRGTANVKVKVRNLLNGAIVKKGYISGRRVEEADLEEQEAKYLYRTGGEYVFSLQDGEELEMPIEKIGEKGRFLKKGMRVKILFWEERPLSLQLPLKVAYRVKQAPPDARGNSASASYKEVLLENNLKVKTPMFIKEEDIIIVDTKRGEYEKRLSRFG